MYLNLFPVCVCTLVNCNKVLAMIILHCQIVLFTSPVLFPSPIQNALLLKIEIFYPWAQVFIIFLILIHKYT